MNGSHACVSVVIARTTQAQSAFDSWSTLSLHDDAIVVNYSPVISVQCAFYVRGVSIPHIVLKH